MMKKFFPEIIFLLTVLVVSLSWGYTSVHWGVYPGKAVIDLFADVTRFVKGDVEEETNLFEKIANDMGGDPERQMIAYHGMTNGHYRKLVHDDFRPRRMAPLVDLQPGAAEGYRFLFGVMDFKQHIHGALLLDPSGEIVHTWHLTEDALKKNVKQYTDLKSEQRPNDKAYEYFDALNRLPQAVEVLEDGSLIVADGDAGNTIHRMDWCSRPEWITVGRYHHTVQLDRDHGLIWSLLVNDIVSLDMETGKITKTLPWVEIIKANPEIDFLVRVDFDSGENLEDTWHDNDIEPLPVSYASAFPMFNAGDLLMSLRSLNAILVIDPDTLKIKWWRMGVTRRQHDPDWEPDGTITIFNNNMESVEEENRADHAFSSIVKINPATYEYKTVIDGARYNFYTRARGKHQFLPNGNVLITSTNQGRAFEVSQNGKLVFDFENRYSEHHNLMLMKSIWLPKDFFKFDPLKKTQCY